MKERLEVVVTSGGTISKIDDVRHIGNFSSGTTGALIAEEFLRKGAKVHYVYGSGAKLPFKRSLNLNPQKPFEDEASRLEKIYREFQEYEGMLIEHPASTFEQYLGTVEDVLTKNPVDVIVLAAAVSDYSAKKQNGKISSDNENMQIELYRNPKVISLIKKWRPEVFQVGFKLLAGVSLHRLVQTAYNHGLKNNSDLTVANLKPNPDFRDSKTVIISPEEDSTYAFNVERSELASKLVEAVYRRMGGESIESMVNGNAEEIFERVS